MRKTVKKIMTISMTVLISVSTVTPNLVLAQDIQAITNNIIKSEKLHGSAVHENVRKYVEGGLQNINVVRIDLNDTNIEVKPIFSNNGLKGRDTISQMVKDSGAIAGINGDFYASFNHSSPLGVMVVDGEMVSTVTERETNIPTVIIDKNNQASISYMGTSLSAVVNKGNTINIKSRNKASSKYDDIRIYDKNWSNQTFGNGLFKDMVEIVINQGIVMDVRVGQPAIAMPQDGEILVGREKAGVILKNNFKVGDKVEIKMSGYPNHGNIKAALGGGSVILREGKFSHNSGDININGKQPRTAIGISKDRSNILLVTVDGRDKDFKGVTQQGLAQIMFDLGAYEAVNLDGGGSTTMVTNVVEGENPKVVNKVSEGSERKVSNGLGIFKKIGPLDHIEIYSDDNNMFSGTSRQLSVKGFDQNKNPVEIKNEDIIFSIDSSKGEFVNNILYAKESGGTTVTATYEDKVVETQINIFDEITEIKFESDKIEMPRNSQKSLGEVFGLNNEGLAIKIDSRDINWKASDGIGEIVNGVINSSSQIITGNITAQIGEKTKNITVIIDDSMISVNKFDNVENIKFDKYPSVVNGSLTLDEEAKEGSHSLKLSYDFTQTDKTRAAYAVLGKDGIALEGQPNQLGMWVKADNNSHWVRGTIIDDAGEKHNIDFAKTVDWNGWKWVTADIPQDIKYPIKVEKVYLAATNPSNKSKGEILLDDLNALY